MRWWLASIADEFLCWLVFCPDDNSVSCWQLKDNFLSPLPVFRILTNNDSTAHVTEWPSVTWGHHHCHLTPASWQHHTCHIVTSVTSPANASTGFWSYWPIKDISDYYESLTVSHVVTCCHLMTWSQKPWTWCVWCSSISGCLHILWVSNLVHLR